MTTTTTTPTNHPLRAGLGTVLGVWAHPDDEAYLAGGVLSALADAGHRVVCVTATRGEAAVPDATAGERAAAAAVRTAELAEALSVLGVTEHHWLDLPDGGCADVDPGLATACLGALVDEVGPATILTFGPDGFTGHPDHRAVSAWVEAVVRRRRERDGHAPRVLHAVAGEHSDDQQIDDDFGVFALGGPRRCRDDEVDVLLALRDAALERKVDALVAQESQTAGIVAAVGRRRFARWVAVERFAAPVEST
jgi:LmbE family N-acetylglucosaminyl deacetylase